MLEMWQSLPSSIQKLAMLRKLVVALSNIKFVSFVLWANWACATRTEAPNLKSGLLPAQLLGDERSHFM
jgi:hypothetical protein